ncbi:class I SAM-dependent methyltransferase [Cytobacillus spongiae]|jgi:tRNA (cmo5U34)-methyltransferase|uniref:class I SAM-dependent methyltransferase n=1 Tax=Cytobacillus spongiae TaxID=2901381 RepID=UPI001F20492D|nr:class I SAM-dependent methyltransferase [Cytobacillus spongiae]UII56580.1 class I SAM-dependent methyltransferase [Cytobacillus spongiae]
MSTNWDRKDALDYQQTIRYKIPGYDLIYEQMVAIIKATKKPEDILVVGAGGGQELVTLSTVFPNVRYTALDPSIQMINLAKARLSNPSLRINWYVTELREVTEQVNYDVITCHLMLHFLKEQKNFIRDVSNRLKPGGLCFISSIIAEEESQSTNRFWQQHLRNNRVPNEAIDQFQSSLGKTTHPVSTELLHQWLKEEDFFQVIPYFKSYFVEAFVAIKGNTPC